MRITPQIVMESIARNASSGVFRTSEAVACTGLRELFDRAVLFHFPDVTLTEHCAFAIDLYERGLFQLPFPVTAIAFERDLGPPLGRRGGMMLLIQSDDGRGISAISCSEVDDGRKETALPIGLVRDASFTKNGDTGVDILEKSTLAIVNDEIVAAMYGPGERGHNILRERLLNNVVNAMALVIMLMSKGVSTELQRPSEKLNKARAKRGKPLIRDRYVVTIDMGDAHRIAQDDGSETDISSHVRGSPRMHWRRGHFRTLYRGTGDERVVPVAPALIGANESADPIRAKTYAVRAPKPGVAA
jgi:hypothetical protein